MDRAHVLHPYTDFTSFAQTGSQIITRAEGMYVTDTDGRQLLDGIAGLWCVNIGHGRAELADAVAPANARSLPRSTAITAARQAVRGGFG